MMILQLQGSNELNVRSHCETNMISLTTLNSDITKTTMCGANCEVVFVKSHRCQTLMISSRNHNGDYSYYKPQFLNSVYLLFFWYWKTFVFESLGTYISFGATYNRFHWNLEFLFSVLTWILCGVRRAMNHTLLEFSCSLSTLSQ